MLMRYLPETGLTIEICDVIAMQADIAAWEDLCGRAVEDNVYATPHYALALLDTLARRDAVKFVTVREGDRLVGLLPVVTSPVAVPGLRARGHAWVTDYTFSATPLLDRSCATDAAAALVRGLRKLGGGEWVIPTINVEGPAGRALIDALESQRVPWTLRAGFERASLAIGQSFDDLMTAQIGAKRRRELARNRRRLEELGEVRHEVHTSGEGLARAIAAFLELEASGWKGERGTALACRPETRAFAERVFAGHGGVRCRADLLLLNGKPIAAGMIVMTGNTGFTVKGAYDEAYAKFSAGLLLEVEVLKSFLSDKWASRLDAATAGEHVIDRLWPDRVKVADLVFSLAAHVPALRLKAHLRVLDAKQAVKDRIKRLLGR